MSKRIEQIVFVIKAVAEEYQDVHPISARRMRVTQDAADYHEVAPQTILDACTRRLGISAYKFDDYLKKLFQNRDKSIFDLLRRQSRDAEDQVAISDLERELVPPPIKLAPSILSADFSRLGEEVAEVTKAGADYIHIDVMDGHFVPNITIGAAVVKALRRWTNLPLDVHLMVNEPQIQIPRFAEAGADIITIHAEVCPHLHQAVQQIKGFKAKAGIALNPGTSLAYLDEILPSLDLVLLMTVDPGSSGQLFIQGMVDKIARLRKRLDELNSAAELEVDGGITPEIAPEVVRAGARVLVAGAAVFDSGKSIKEALQSFREALSGEGI